MSASPFRGSSKSSVHRKEWVVYSKTPFVGPEQVVSYLGRYTHRVGLSNYRLPHFDQDGVSFLTKNGSSVTLPPDEFIRRFLLHGPAQGLRQNSPLRPHGGQQRHHET